MKHSAFSSPAAIVVLGWRALVMKCSVSTRKQVRTPAVVFLGWEQELVSSRNSPSVATALSMVFLGCFGTAYEVHFFEGSQSCHSTQAGFEDSSVKRNQRIRTWRWWWRRQARLFFTLSKGKSSVLEDFRGIEEVKDRMTEHVSSVRRSASAVARRTPAHRDGGNRVSGHCLQFESHVGWLLFVISASFWEGAVDHPLSWQTWLLSCF